MWWDGNGGGWGPGSWLLMSAMMLLFWGLIAALLIWAVRSTRRERQPVTLSKPSGRLDGAEAVLAERFARGEIDEVEFARRRDVLHGKNPRS